GRHSCEPLNFSLCRAVLAVATDICAQHQRTFSFQCFVLGGFWFLFASGSLEPRTFCSSATTRRSRCSRGLVLIASSNSPSICQMRAIQVSRFVNRKFSYIVTSMLLLPASERSPSGPQPRRRNVKQFIQRRCRLRPECCIDLRLCATPKRHGPKQGSPPLIGYPHDSDAAVGRIDRVPHEPLCCQRLE